MSIDQVMEKGGATNMADLTGDDTAGYAYRMTYQNQQIGIKVPAGRIMDADNVKVEIRYYVPSAEAGQDLRLGLGYKTSLKTGDILSNGNIAKVGADGQLDYGGTTLNFGIDGVQTDEWQVWETTLDKANYASGGNLNIVKWGTGNDAGNEKDAYYIQSILIYAGERPSEDDLYIRADVIGSVDFVDGDEDGVTTTAMTEKFQEEDAVKLANSDATMKADSSIVAVNDPKDGTDKNVTVMFEYYATAAGSASVNDKAVDLKVGEWAVATAAFTDNATQDFKIAFAGEGDAAMYIRKVVIARTNLIPAAFTAEGAFVWYDDTYAQYPLFPRVKSSAYNMSAAPAGQNEGSPAEVQDVDGTNAMTGTSGYLYANVNDTFNGKPDLGVTITYFDKGTAYIDVQYNAKVPEGAEDGEAYRFKAADSIKLENTEEWKTVTVYVADADFRNAQDGGNDFRISLGSNGDDGVSISAVGVKIGADKTELNTLIVRRINTIVYTPESVANYNVALAAANTVAANVNATKAQVDEAIKNLNDAYAALERIGGDKRFTLSEGAIASINLTDNSNGEIVTYDGWYAWKFPTGQSGKWLGLADGADVLKDSKSVTYEYDIMFVSSDNNSRCFLAYGAEDGWHGVKEGAPPTGTGFAVGGQWGEVPSVGKWGTISIVNDSYDPTKLSPSDLGHAANMTTALGSWMNTATCDLYVRAIRVYDTEDPSKMISLTFNEDVKEMIVTGENDNVRLVEKDGDKAYLIPSGWQKILIDTESVLETGILTKGENNVTVEFEYFLEELNGNGDANNEMFQITHFNPQGNGQNGDKASECEHQFYPNNGDLKRGEWQKKVVVLDDANFGEGLFALKYGNGNELYVRGIKIYATETPKNAAVWGTMKLTAPALDYAYWDFGEQDGSGLTVKFAEGSEKTEYGTMVDGNDVSYDCALVSDDWMYVTLDKEMFPSDARYIKITMTYMDTGVIDLHYNKVVDVTEPADTESDEWKNFNETYNFAKSGQITTDDQGNMVIGNPLGMLPAGDGNWVTDSIYLTDAQFRKKANGADFRVDAHGSMMLARIEVRVITEEDLPKMADLTDLKKAVADAEEMDVSSYTEESVEKFEEALAAAQALANRGRATEEQAAATLKALQDAVKGLVSAVKLGDVDGNDAIDSSDARMVLQASVQKITLTEAQTKAADVNKDDKIDSSDARVILQVSVGKAEL
jgi:hypothetical protein